MKINEIYKKIRAWNHKRRIMRKQRKHRKEVLSFIEEKVSQEEKQDLINFFMNEEFQMIPYIWRNTEHNKADICVYYDRECDLNYVDWHGKRMYWKRGETVERIQGAVNNLLIEQDRRSPHRYVIDERADGAIIGDIGTAEGCFSLDVIDRAKHIYLFECENEWIEALEKTFLPWKEKITIVNKFVGDKSNDYCTTLDDFFEEIELDYIKADIEGAELSMLYGAKKTLKNKIKTINICAYHNPEDEAQITNILAAEGYKCMPNKGYLFFNNNIGTFEGYLRRGVVYASKNLIAKNTNKMEHNCNPHN